MKLKAYLATRPRACVYLAILAIALLTGGLLVVRSISENTAVILLLNYLCKLLTLLIGILGLGLAFFAAARRAHSSAAAALAVSTAGYAIPQTVGAVCTAIAYMEYDFGVTLGIMLGTAFANTLLQLGLYVAVFFFAYLLILRRGEVTSAPLLFSRRDPYTGVNLLAVSVLFVYQLAGQIYETVIFVLDYAPNIYPSEIATMVFDFVFLVITMILSFVVLYAVELFAHERIPQA